MHSGTISSVSAMQRERQPVDADDVAAVDRRRSTTCPRRTAACRSGRSRSRAKTATPTPAAASAATSATHLWSCSSVWGMSSITSAPASGRNTMRVRPQSVRNWLLSMWVREPWRSRQTKMMMAPANTAAAPNRSAPYCWTLPEVSWRKTWPLLSAAAADAVDGAVDHLLVDARVDEAADDGRRADPAAVDHAVDDVLVDPVGGPGDRALDAADDDVGVEAVEVVLVDEHR